MGMKLEVGRRTSKNHSPGRAQGERRASATTVAARIAPRHAGTWQHLARVVGDRPVVNQAQVVRPEGQAEVLEHDAQFRIEIGPGRQRRIRPGRMGEADRPHRSTARAGGPERPCEDGPGGGEHRVETPSPPEQAGPGLGDEQALKQQQQNRRCGHALVGGHPQAMRQLRRASWLARPAAGTQRGNRAPANRKVRRSIRFARRRA